MRKARLPYRHHMWHRDIGAKWLTSILWKIGMQFKIKSIESLRELRCRFWNNLVLESFLAFDLLSFSALNKINKYKIIFGTPSWHGSFKALHH